MIELKNKADCTGCGACKDICPVKAITLVPDDEGFLYPEVEADKCVRCGMCLSTCPVLNSGEEGGQKDIEPAAFAAYTKDRSLRMASSSGGVFSELAKVVLDAGGVVFGAAFDKTFSVRHICVTDVAELDRLRGSKYVQSEIGAAYFQAKEYLEQGRTVLFTGTPCQIEGLHAFLGREWDTLITQDIICHGVPSPKVWQSYVALREKKAASKTRGVFFRHKKYGWKTYSLQIEFANSEQYTERIQDDLYMRGFLRNLCLRPSCHHCAFKRKYRRSDITLADFWGIEKVCPQMDDDKGTSLVILHSGKGRALFDSIQDKLNCEPVDFEAAIRYNSAMTCSAEPGAARGDYIHAAGVRGFAGAKKYVRDPLNIWIRKRIKACLKAFGILK